VDDQDVDSVIDLARQECRARKEFVPVQNLPVLGEIGSSSEPLEVRVGGATVFVMEVERFDRFDRVRTRSRPQRRNSSLTSGRQARR
jgi:uncharacterized protein YaaQ